jgi:hypothetical protein
MANNPNDVDNDDPDGIADPGDFYYRSERYDDEDRLFVILRTEFLFPFEPNTDNIPNDPNLLNYRAFRYHDEWDAAKVLLCRTVLVVNQNEQTEVVRIDNKDKFQRVCERFKRFQKGKKKTLELEFDLVVFTPEEYEFFKKHFPWYCVTNVDNSMSVYVRYKGSIFGETEDVGEEFRRNIYPYLHKIVISKQNIASACRIFGGFFGNDHTVYDHVEVLSIHLFNEGHPDDGEMTLEDYMTRVYTCFTSERFPRLLRINLRPTDATDVMTISSFWDWMITEHPRLEHLCVFGELLGNIYTPELEPKHRVHPGLRVINIIGGYFADERDEFGNVCKDFFSRWEFPKLEHIRFGSAAFESTIDEHTDAHNISAELLGKEQLNEDQVLWRIQTNIVATFRHLMRTSLFLTSIEFYQFHERYVPYLFQMVKRMNVQLRSRAAVSALMLPARYPLYGMNAASALASRKFVEPGLFKKIVEFLAPPVVNPVETEDEEEDEEEEEE